MQSTRNSSRSNFNSDYQASYDYVFDLDPGEDIQIGDEVLFGYVGLNNNTRQARFRIEAPMEVSILRLEVFAKHMQEYDYTLDVNFGQKVKIGEEIELIAIPDKHGRKLVHIGIETPRELEVHKSLKNEIPEKVMIEVERDNGPISE